MQSSCLYKNLGAEHFTSFGVLLLKVKNVGFKTSSFESYYCKVKVIFVRRKVMDLPWDVQTEWSVQVEKITSIQLALSFYICVYIYVVLLSFWRNITYYSPIFTDIADELDSLLNLDVAVRSLSPED